MTLAAQWRDLELLLEQRGLGWAVHRAPPTLRVARSADHPFGARWSHLVPDDYRAFVAAVGYPVLGFRYYCRDGFSFLPPEHIGAISVNLPDPDETFPTPVNGAPTECRHAFFAGYELSDIEGWSFGPGSDGALAVWLVEGGMPREECGTFSEWLTAEIARLRSLVERFSEAEIKELCDEEREEDPHRVIDYSLDKRYDVPAYSAEDLALHWVESQDGTPYSYGLVHDQRGWVIPMSKRFESVRPFRDGVAEVVPYIPWPSGPMPAGKGEWRRLRADGSLIDPG